MNLRLRVKRFADNTTIHGFRDFYYSKALVFKVLWSIIMLSALCLTVFHITQSVHGYLNNPTMITFESIEQGQMKYPDLMICYPHWIYWVDSRKVARLGFSKAAALYGLSYLSPIFTSSVFDIDEAKCAFDRQMSKNNFTHLTQFYRAIAYAYPQRTNLRQFRFKHKFLYHYEDSLCYVLTSETLVREAKTDLFGLLFGFYVKHDQVVHRNSDLVDELEYINYLRYMFAIVGSLPTNQIPNETLSTFSMPLFLQMTEKFFHLVMLSNDVERYIVSVTATVHRSKNKPGKPCTDYQSKKHSFDYECLLECFAEAREKVIGDNEGIEFRFALLLNETYQNVCQYDIYVISNATSIEEFADPLNSVSTENCSLQMRRCEKVLPKFPVDWDMCNERCIPKCEQWNFERSVTPIVNPRVMREYAKQTNTTVTVHYPKEQSIIVMSEVESTTWDRLIADIGGLLGIWLGASIMSFVQMIYQCCFSEWDRKVGERAVIERKNAKRKNETPPPHEFRDFQL